MEQLTVVKIGGNIIDNPTELEQFLTLFEQLEGKKILVHGGGKIATQLSHQMGLQPVLLDGRRITDAEMLKVVTMVYAGLTNKTIVAQLQAKNVNAIGLSGADANSIQSTKRPVAEVDYGFVGDLNDQSVNATFIEQLLENGQIPVFCAITHDGKGQLLNTNADTIASGVAIALAQKYAVDLVYAFEKKGVLQDIADENSVIPFINRHNISDLRAKGIVTDGMLPKLSNSIFACAHGVKKVIIKKANDLLDPKAGTIIND